MDIAKQIQQLADRMDIDAENTNADEFVITHRALAVLAVEVIGRDATLQLMRALRKEKGLPGLTGVCGKEPRGGTILKRKKIAEDWGKWQLP